MSRVSEETKYYAWSLVTSAIARGVLVSAKELLCQYCFGPAIHYHHFDYEEPFNIVPVCHDCHIQIHYGVKDD